MNNTTRIAASISRLVLSSDSAPVSLTQGSLLILRVVIGTVMVHHGFDKLADIPDFAESYVAAIGLPFPIFFAYCAAITEVVASPLLALGFFSRPAALGLLSTMLVANYHHIVTSGFSIPTLELSLLYAAAFAFFAVYGGGKYSIDTLIAKSLDKLLSVSPESDAIAQPIKVTVSK
jgi:putative oxidoreductase